jgi:hypothetical protein
MLLALEERFQLGTEPSTLSSLMILASTVGQPQETWIKDLLRFLCKEGYLKRLKDTYEVLRSVPILREDEEFAQRCLKPFDYSKRNEPELTGGRPNEESTAQDESTVSDSSEDSSVLEALTARTIELTEATRDLQESVQLQASEAEALKGEIAKQREEFRSLTAELKGEVLMMRNEITSEVTAVLDLLSKSEAIGEHSRAVTSLRESVKSLTESVRPLKDGASEYRKAIEDVASRYESEVAIRNTRMESRLITIRSDLMNMFQRIEEAFLLKTSKKKPLLPTKASKSIPHVDQSLEASATFVDTAMKEYESTKKIVHTHFPQALDALRNKPKGDSILPSPTERNDR